MARIALGNRHNQDHPHRDFGLGYRASHTSAFYPELYGVYVAQLEDAAA